MAGFFDRLNQGLTNLSQSPAGMAGLGLLMMPSQSPTPINPWQYAAEGMQAGVQNRRRAQTMQALQERQSQEDEYREMRYLMEAYKYQQEMLDRAAAQRRAEEQQRNEEAYISGIEDPAQAALARALGPGYMKLAAEAALRPKQMTSVEKNARALGLAPGTAEYDQYIRAATLPAPSTTINVGGRPLTPNELSGLELPGGGRMPIGTTMEQAAKLGAAPIPKPPTEGQALSAGFYQRMSQANEAMTPERERLLSRASEAIAARTPLIGNYLSSPEYQVARQAQEDFVTAVLRKESGAVIGNDEMQNAIRKYFPQPGDREEVIKQKRKLRDTETQSMRRAAGRAFQASTQSPMTTPAGVSVTPNFNGGQQSIEDIARKYLK